MKKIFFLLLATFIYLNAISQGNFGSNPFAVDINGRPLYEKTEYRSEGSPFVYEDYTLADLLSAQGVLYKSIQVKFNIAENKLIYLDSKGKEMLALTPITGIYFYPFRKDYITYDAVVYKSHSKPLNISGAPVYQVVGDSSARLYKQISISYRDDKPLHEATITRVFTRKETYFALLKGDDSTLHKVEKNPNQVTGLFGNKASLVKAYIENNKLNSRSEKDLALIFRYYNTLE
jgi:hypothetical protein